MEYDEEKLNNLIEHKMKQGFTRKQAMKLALVEARWDDFYVEVKKRNNN
ncbi:MAG: hypothetical protein LBQ74_13735 [Prevotella sp.]|jgi:hypothetical protein|nr:hypothetical protein [Prevotella sp.]